MVLPLLISRRFRPSSHKPQSRRSHDLVEQQVTEYEPHEPYQLQPFEALPARRQPHDPDEYCSKGVNATTVRSTERPRDSQRKIVVDARGDHHEDAGRIDARVMDDLMPTGTHVEDAVATIVGATVGDMGDRLSREYYDEARHTLVADKLEGRDRVARQDGFFEDELRRCKDLCD